MAEDKEQQPESLLPYDDWVEAAMRQVVARALAHAVANGLPGEHHFYVTFRTDYPGVVIPQRLRAQYPQEMTIVLQHQFWGLEVEEEAFSVTLSFNGQSERLTIPFAAIATFADPSVKFGLQFAAVPAETAGLPAPLPTAAAKRPEASAKLPAAEPAERPEAEIVTLDRFRKR